MNRLFHRFFAFIALTGIIAVYSGCDTPTKDPDPIPPRGAMLIVANQAGGAGNLATVDLQTGAVRLGAVVVGITPNDLIYKSEKLYVINSGSHSLNILELTTQRTLALTDTIDLGAAINRSPQFADLSEGNIMWISNFTDGTLTVFDLNRRRVTAYLPVGRSPADVLVVGNKVYVCNSGFNPQTFEYEAGTVSVVNATTKEIDRTISVGLNPQFLAKDPSGRVHVICTGNYNDIEGEIDIINTAADTVAQVINIGGQPGHLAITSTGIGYIAAGGWPPDSDGKVYSYNANTGRILRGPANPIRVGLGAQRLAIGADGAVYVSCSAADRVDRLIGEARVESYAVGDEPVPMVVIE